MIDGLILGVLPLLHDALHDKSTGVSAVAAAFDLERHSCLVLWQVVALRFLAFFVEVCGGVWLQRVYALLRFLCRFGGLVVGWRLFFAVVLVETLDCT